MAEPFTEDEFIIVLDHYFSVRDEGKLDEKALSAKLRSFGAVTDPAEPEHHRTGEGLRRVIGRFAAVDPDSPSAFGSYSDRLQDEPLVDYRRIWRDHAHDRDAVRARAENLLKSSSPIQAKKRIGEISDVPVGTVFESRAELAESGVHRPLRAGICGTAATGAESIVLSGGYEDDVDLGSTLLYTGHGGNDHDSHSQVADQELSRQNLALAVSCDRGLPVRVVRGSDSSNPHAPESGYRYDGLHSVDSYDQVTGKSGFLIWRFRLVQDDAAEASGVESQDAALTASTAKFSTVQRRIRNTAVAQAVKELHDYTCQFCGLRIETATGGYAEGAHIRALGLPHNGPDVPSNVLCLCPNDHVRFDRGTLVIEDSLEIREVASGSTVGALRTLDAHQIDKGQIRYHRDHHVKGS